MWNLAECSDVSRLISDRTCVGKGNNQRASNFLRSCLHPPGAETSICEACCDETELSLSSMKQTNDTIFLGDFNMPGISWVEDTDLPGVFIPVALSPQAEILVDRLF